MGEPARRVRPYVLPRGACPSSLFDVTREDQCSNTGPQRCHAGLGQARVRWHPRPRPCVAGIASRVSVVISFPPHREFTERENVLQRSCKYLSALAAATLLYNTVDSPVGVVPVTHVRQSDAATTEWTNPRVGAGHGSPVVEKLLYGTPDERGIGRGGFYDADQMAGIPVGVQVVGRKWEEEKVIEMMKVVDGALGSRPFGPLSWQQQGP